MRAHFLAVAGLLTLSCVAGAAHADSQSSNSSSNCSNGVCTRVDSYVIQDEYDTRGWTRYEVWEEQPRRHRWRAYPPPWRDDEDDDDDD